MTAVAALSGLLVADFSRVLAGPYATMLLGDLGADVIKIEQPGSGDDTRSWGPPFAADEATYFLSVNRNKRSLTADFTDRSSRRRLRELVRRADVLIENFRPGTMAKYGLSYDEAHAINPRLVYCSITGFGSGKGAALPGYDLLVQAVGGLMSVTGPGPGQPVKTGAALVDVLTGLHATVGILAALRAREQTGQGQHVEVNLLSTLLASLVNQSAGYTAGGAVPGILGNRHPSIAPYEVFPTSDRPIAVAVGNDRQFAALCGGLELPELMRDSRFRTNTDRVAHVDELAAVLTPRLATRSAADWVAELTPLGVPCGPVNDLAAAFDFAETLGLAPTAEVGAGGDAVRLPANPIGLSATPARYAVRPPGLGEHTDDIARWLDQRAGLKPRVSRLAIPTQGIPRSGDRAPHDPTPSEQSSGNTSPTDTLRGDTFRRTP
jgi:crotonobetainyl-CoA:carnitine CoA-transferase CaiB-like acyl-CoA transferase